MNGDVYLGRIEIYMAEPPMTVMMLVPLFQEATQHPYEAVVAYCSRKVLMGGEKLRIELGITV